MGLEVDEKVEDLWSVLSVALINVRATFCSSEFSKTSICLVRGNFTRDYQKLKHDESLLGEHQDVPQRVQQDPQTPLGCSPGDLNGGRRQARPDGDAGEPHSEKGRRHHRTTQDSFQSILGGRISEKRQSAQLLCHVSVTEEYRSGSHLTSTGPVPTRPLRSNGTPRDC